MTEDQIIVWVAAQILANGALLLLLLALAHLTEAVAKDLMAHLVQHPEARMRALVPLVADCERAALYAMALIYALESARVAILGG